MIRIWAMLLLGCVTGITIGNSFVVSTTTGPPASDYELTAFSGKVIAHNTKKKTIKIRGKSTFFKSPDIDVIFKYNNRTIWINEIPLIKRDYVIGILYETNKRRSIAIGDIIRAERTPALESLLQSVTIVKVQEL